MIDVNQITTLQADCTTRWHQEPIARSASDFYALVEANHENNYRLWHEEDNARRDDKGFEFVYRAKRNIDGFNQQRNDAMEAMDQWLFNHFQPRTEGCPVHSESPGMMIDRLSILALKHYHMKLQAERADADQAHREKCQRKLEVIIAQQQQLSACLREFFTELANGQRTFRVYYQFKMYNDPNLNPALYQSADA